MTFRCIPPLIPNNTGLGSNCNGIAVFSETSTLKLERKTVMPDLICIKANLLPEKYKKGYLINKQFLVNDLLDRTISEFGSRKKIKQIIWIIAE